MNARTEAELDVWLGVVRCLSGMRDMSDTQRRQLADRALELMRQSEADRHADVVVDAGPTDADLRGEVSYGG